MRRLPRRVPSVDSGRTPDGFRAGVPVRVAGSARVGRAVHPRTHLRPARQRLRAAQHAHPLDQPLLPTGAARHRHGAVADATRLDRTGPPSGDRAGLPVAGGADHLHRPDADAVLRRRTAAVRAAVPGRGRRAHRPAHGSQGPQPGRRGRAGAGRRDRRLVRHRRRDPPGRLLGALPAPGLAGPALLVVADNPAAHLRHRRRLRPAATTVASGLRRVVDRCGHHTGRELRRLPAGGLS